MCVFMVMDRLAKLNSAKLNPGLLGMGGMLGLAGTACVLAALWLTTDAYHTVLFFCFGLVTLLGSAILLWRGVRG
jgi:hypothetical protein